MGLRRSVVRTVAAVLVVGLALVGCDNSKQTKSPPTTPPTSARTSVVARVAAHGVVSGPTGACTCAGGGVAQPGAANGAKPQP